MSCSHRLNDYGLIDATSSILRRNTHQPHNDKDEDQQRLYLLATSSYNNNNNNNKESRLLVKGPLDDDGLCQHQKTFFAHWKPRTFIVGVSGDFVVLVDSLFSCLPAGSVQFVYSQFSIFYCYFYYYYLYYYRSFEWPSNKERCSWLVS
jgi:hypothetical protein